MNNTEFIKSVKLVGAVPENQLQFDDDTLLDVATEEMHERMAPFVSLINSGYLQTDVTMQIVNGQAGYRVTQLASYGGFKDVWLSSGGNLTPLIPIDQTEKSNDRGQPKKYYFSGSKIMLDPIPNENGTLVLSVKLRPSRMTPMTNHAQITAIDLVLNTLTVSSLPSTITAGSYVDVQAHTSIHEIIQSYNAVSSINANVITLASPISTDVSVGDYVSPFGTCAFPQIPIELHSTLALMAASRCLMSLGQLDQKAAIDTRISENLSTFKVTMWPRGRGENQKIVSPHL